MRVDFLEMIDITSGIMITLIGIISVLYTCINTYTHREDKSIKKEVDITLKDIQEQKDYDVFKLLYKNVTESTQYYVISKRQASKSFALAVVSCILGVTIYICGFLIVAFLDKDITLLTTISGTIAELITGLSFWIYNKCIKQLNEYHKRLNSTERYLTSIQMADKMSEANKEEMYKWLIQNVMLFDLSQNDNKKENKSDSST